MVDKTTYPYSAYVFNKGTYFVPEVKRVTVRKELRDGVLGVQFGGPDKHDYVFGYGKSLVAPDPSKLYEKAIQRCEEMAAELVSEANRLRREMEECKVTKG